MLSENAKSLLTAIAGGYKFSQGDADFVEDWLIAHSPREGTKTLAELKAYLFAHNSPQDYRPVEADFFYQRDPRCIVLMKLFKYRVEFNWA